MKKAILIDDEPLILQAVKKLLERNKLSIEVIGEANNGIEALELIERDKPDLIFLDIRMPLMDGFGLLKWLSEKNISVKTIILTAYRDFNYASEAIQFGAFGYLVKPIDEAKFIEIVEKVCLKIDEERQKELANQQLNNMMKTSFLERLLEGSELKHLEEIERSIPELRNENCQVIILKSALTIPEADPLLKPLGPRSIFYYKGDIIVIYNHQAYINIDELQAVLIEILKEVQLRAGGEFACTIGVSAPCVTLQHLRKAYLQAKAAIFYQQTSHAPNILLFPVDFLHSLNEQELIVNHRMFVQFAEKMVLGLQDEARELIRQYKEKLADATPIDLDLVYHHYFQFVTHLKHAMTKANIQERHKTRIAGIQFSEIQSYRTLNSLSYFFEQLISEFSLLSQTEETNRMIQKIKQYIQENYAKDISLHSLAEQLFVSKNYVSTIFKQKTGVNYLDYLTNVRMEQAKIRLETTEKGINQIMVELGYKNASHFGKVFKQEVGVTPAEYRQRISNNQ